MKFFLDNVEENNNTLFCYLVIFDIDHISTLLTSKRKKSILYESNNTTNLFVWKITIISTYLPTTDFDLDNNSINDLIDIIPTFFNYGHIFYTTAVSSPVSYFPACYVSG